MDLNDLKIGTIILWEKQPVQVIWSNRMRTAQRKPVMQTKMRNVITGKVCPVYFNPSAEEKFGRLNRRFPPAKKRKSRTAAQIGSRGQTGLEI